MTIDTGYKNVGASDLKASKKGKQILIKNLETICREYKINNAVLKMDCEGCEYATILDTSNETLNKFDQIIIEYHYGYLDIEKKLKEAGFKIRHTAPTNTYNQEAKTMMTSGILFAEK